ncbi:MAG: HAMP domain-containing sensor histidine kinase [Pseudomonadota bacterium]|nr:HAMP domain-containing sensor histidine kinase [Pseudomonadota bacterium]
MSTRQSLRRKMMIGLIAYALLLAIATLIQGALVNERAEQLTLASLLQSQLHHHRERSLQEPGYHWRDSEQLKLHDSALAPLPPILAKLGPGVHDDIRLDGHDYVALIEQHGGHRQALLLDIGELEEAEYRITMLMLASTLLLSIVLAMLAAWGVRRLLLPLRRMAHDIEQLDSARPGARLSIDANDSVETATIGNALNDYLDRNARFIERERLFIDSASHELRTPISVIRGATSLALEEPALPANARRQIERAHRSSGDVEQLISLLLVLARSPERLAAISGEIALDQLIPQIVQDHLPLTEGRQLQIDIAPLPPVRIQAPPGVVQAAIGNLLRNAIENSDRGVIRIDLDTDANVLIEDPGHGMSPEEISRLHHQLTRGGGREGGGIGLDLLARLCEHLGWRLQFEPGTERGTRSRLAMGTPQRAQG